MSKRFPTSYSGVYYRIVPRIGAPGEEKAFYAVYRRDNKWIETMVGRQFMNAMTPAKASQKRALLIDGKAETRQAKLKRETKEKDSRANRPTIARLWELYLEGKSIKGLATDKNRFEKHLAPHFADKIPAEIDPLSIDRLRMNMGKTYAPATVANTLELLRRIINFGVNRGLCETPKFKIRLPKVDNLQTEDLTQEQLQRLLRTLGETENQAVAQIMTLALFTGMRKGEILKLQWTDLDYERGFIMMRDPKGGLGQLIPMNPQARELLQRLPQESSYVFPGRDGGQRVELRRAARKIIKEAGLPDCFRAMHGLRHAYASMLASSGQVDIYTLQKLMTHKSASMTARYAHLTDMALQRAAGVAGDIVQKAQDVGGEATNVVIGYSRIQQRPYD